MAATLLRLIRLLLLLVTITPLIRSKSSFFGEVSDRSLFFWFITEICVFLWIILCTMDAKFLPRLQGLSVALGLWTFSLSISTVLAANQILSFFSTFERMTGMLTYLHLLGFFLVLSSVFKSADWKKLIICLFVSGFISSFLALIWRTELQFDWRIIGTLGNPSFLAFYTVIQVFVSGLVFWGLRKSVYRNWAVPVFIPVFLIHTSVIVLTGSRSGIISILAGSIVSLLLTSILVPGFRFQIYGFFVIVLGAIIFFTVGEPLKISGPLAHLNRIFNISLSTDTFLVRQNLWRVAWSAFQERPVFGWGFEGFSTAFLKYYNPILYKDGLWYDNPHNIFLDWLISGGFMALAGFLACSILGLLFLWKSKTIPVFVKVILSGYCVSYFVFNFNNFDSISTLVLLFVFWAYVHSQQQCVGLKAFQWVVRYRIVLRASATLIFLFGMYFFVLKSYEVKRGIVQANENPDLASATFAYKKLYEKAWLGKYDVLIQASLKRSDVNSNTDRNVGENYYVAIQQIMQQGIVSFPASGQLLNQAGHLNVYFGQLPKAVTYFEKLRTLAPNRQTNLLDLGIAYMESGRFSEATQLFEQIYNLDRSNQLPLIYQAISQSRNNKYSDAQKTLALVSRKNIAINGELVRLAFKDNETGDYCKLYSEMSETDRQLISQNTYWVWINTAFEAKDFVQLRTAINCYRFSYSIPESEIMPILDSAIISGIRPVAIRNFFTRFPDR